MTSASQLSLRVEEPLERKAPAARAAGRSLGAPESPRATWRARRCGRRRSEGGAAPDAGGARSGGREGPEGGAVPAGEREPAEELTGALPVPPVPKAALVTG